MRITIWPSAYHPSLGGVEELTDKLVKQYTMHGHECEVVVNRWPKSLLRQECVDGVIVNRFSFRLPERSLKIFLQFMFYVWNDLFRLFGTCFRSQSDVHHVICCSSNLPYALLITKLLRKPLVVTAQGEIGMDASGLYQSDTYVPRNFSRFIQHAAWITACSAHTSHELFEYSGTSRCTVIHNGIDIEEFDSRHHNPRSKICRPYVFAMGRHVHQKGFDVLIRAWHQLQLQYQDYDLVIGGDGSDTELLRDLIRDCKMETSVHLIGRLDRVGVVSHLQHAACFVLPSRHEPFGIVVLEAMAARTPVIATAVGGVPEFVTQGVNGRLVEGDNVNALALAIQDCVINGVSEAQLNAGYETAVAHSWSTIAGKYLEIYSTCITGGAQA